MKWMILGVLSIVFEVTLSNCTHADQRSTFLWSIERDNIRGFLFGTIHVPYTQVWDRVSDLVKEAFDRSDGIVFEVDLHDHSTIRKLIKCKNLKRRKTAQLYLPQSVFARLQNYMHEFHRYLLQWAKKQDDAVEARRKADDIYNSVVVGWERKRPEWLLFVLYQLCENLFDMDSSPMLDSFLAQKAQEQHKMILSVETPEEQCNPITSLSQEQIIFAINYTLSYLEHTALTRTDVLHADRGKTVDLIRNYRCGSLEKNIFDKSNLTGFQPSPQELQAASEIDKLLKYDILLKRNSRMATRLDSILTKNTNKQLFTAIGTGHFLGDNNLLDHLLKMGYTITSVKPEDILINFERPRVHHFNALWVREVTPEENIELTIEIVENKQPKIIYILTYCLVFSTSLVYLT